jgi:hypothetical protein
MCLPTSADTLNVFIEDARFLLGPPQLRLAMDAP